jgi:CRISPR/Cas system-associated protein Cas10 (large subunit of type III CRISPR-Cas system)
MKTCTECRVEKPPADYYNNVKTNKCRSCLLTTVNAKNKLVRSMFGKGTTRKVLKEHAPVGQPCDCCGKEMDSPNFDHCHETNEFRGWLCKDCNTAIGKLGDNLEGVMNAVRYLS